MGTKPKPSSSAKKQEVAKPTFDITKHILVPKHELLPKGEAEKLLKTFNISPHQLPVINECDPIAKAINAKVGDIVKITRSGPLKDYLFFRRVAA